MDGRTLELGSVADLSAESFGEPGQRTFRLLIRSGDGTVSVWLEKEQVVALGSAIDELVQRVPEDLGRQPDADAPTFMGTLEVTAASLAVGFDSQRAGYTFEASDFESPFDLTSISLVATRDQIEHVGEQIRDIVSKSRPRCVLCGTPLTGGPHFCPPSNGHAHISHTRQ